MPCINLDLEYFSHRKVLRLCAKLGPWAEIIPLKLWAYTGKFHPETGHLTGYSVDELITMIGVRLDSGWDASSILQALLDCGFLVPAVGGYHVHQWLEYQGHIAAFSIRGKTAAKKRWAKLKEFSEKDATSIPDAMLDCIPSNAPTNPTNVSNPTNPTDDKRASKRFVKPTVEQISEYCLERENDLDAKYFYDSYEARGWKIGSSSMKDWKATVRTWEQRKNDFKPKGNQNGPNSHKHEKNSREFTERLTL